MADRLSPVDNVWLRMDRPDNLMMITGVLTFDTALDMDLLRRLLSERLQAYPRFRQRVERRGWDGSGSWVEAEDFDLDQHVDRRLLPEPADRATLRRVIGELVSQPLDMDRPLWKLHVIENPRDGRTVLLCRLHHCLGDGFALMYVMLGLTDDRPDAPIERRLEVAGSAPGGLTAAAGRFWEAGREMADALRKRPRSVARRGGQVVMDLARLATLSTQPRDTCLRGTLGRQKRAAWSAPVEIETVKAVGKALGGTVNDVLLAAVAGALRSYLLHHGEQGFDMRTVVPVNLRRSREEFRQLGNHLGLVFLELPLHEPDARRRFRITKARMDRIKRSPEAFVLWAMMQVVGLSPRWVEEIVIALLGSKSTTVVTNVPGPRQPRYLVGQRIQTIMFWVPQTGRVGFGLSIFSYAGLIRLGLASDQNLIPDPETVLDGFPAALDELAAAAGASPS